VVGSKFLDWTIGSIWWARHAAALRSQLWTRHGLRQLVPLQRDRWHRGGKYFRAKARSDDSVFLKTDESGWKLHNEISAANALRAQGRRLDRFAPIRFFDSIGGFHIAGFDWLDGVPLDQATRHGIQLELKFIVSELQGILSDLERAAVVHRDITPSNLILIRDANSRYHKIALIDFAFAVVHGHADFDAFAPLSDLADLGSGYKPEASKWDDGFSCRRIIEALFPPEVAIGAVRAFPLDRAVYSFDWNLECAKRRAWLR